MFYLKWAYYLVMKKNPIAKDLRTPKYKLKVAPDKKKYSRKNQPNPDSLAPDKN